MKKLARNIFIVIGLCVAVAYRLRRHLIAWALELTRVKNTVEVVRGVRVPMKDQIMLTADHYSPPDPGNYPTILIRTPYGRNANDSSFGLLLSLVAQRFAERGYHVIVQDVRGRFESQGEFTPYFNEKEDGLATLEWIDRQPWSNGVVGTWGSSYLGIVQWAVAAHSPLIQACVPSITGSDSRRVLYPDDALDLGLALRWMAILEHLHKNKTRHWIAGLRLLQDAEKDITPALTHLPLKNADRIATGETKQYYQDWLEHESADDPMWQQEREKINIAGIDAPVHLIGGWYDFFLRALLDDYNTLKQAGKSPHLTIGPWHHFTAMIRPVDIRAAINWFDAHLKGDRRRLREHPVRVYIMGADEWRSFQTWPPRATATQYYLHTGQRLDTQPPIEATAPDCFIYNPKDPTPIVGGAQFHPLAGAKDNRPLAARPDVLTYITSPLETAREVIGHVRLNLYARSSQPTSDFFARLVDVHPDGKMVNICDGLCRATPADDHDAVRIDVDMWATAHQFQAGHRIGLLIAGGAHPHWNRNPGMKQTTADVDQLHPAEQTIYHDLRRPSALVLPVYR